jgi:hypothetical protein
MYTLTTVSDSMAEHAMFSRMEAYEFNHYPEYRSAEYAAYMEEEERRHAEGRGYPIGDQLPCYTCARENPDEKPWFIDDYGFRYVNRVCTGYGPVVNRADATQTYMLDCGHGTI